MASQDREQRFTDKPAGGGALQSVKIDNVPLTDDAGTGGANCAPSRDAINRYGLLYRKLAADLVADPAFRAAVRP